MYINIESILVIGFFGWVLQQFLSFLFVKERNQGRFYKNNRFVIMAIVNLNLNWKISVFCAHLAVDYKEKSFMENPASRRQCLKVL